MKSELPKIESKKCSEMYKLLKEMIPHYTPEWTGSDPKDAGIALLKIFSQINENVINRLNQVPKKNFVAFLDMLGISLLPAQPAKSPITFKLAKGIDTEVLIPKTTQVTAGKTTEHEELPFETEKELLATPSQLKAVVSVDPAIDAIHVPPPNFLDGKIQKQNNITYSIVSSPSAGSNNFQLDNVADLKPGNFLSLGDTNHEYVVISKINGMIVQINDKLSKDYPSGTPVEKIVKFNLFDSKNVQEHSLYLGHKDLFNIKSTAQFILFINHRVAKEGVLFPLDVSWEYWGEISGEEGEGWKSFDTVDGTFGLSKDGTVILNKNNEGEIKEKEINGVKSRWIRCILTKPLDMDAPLPVLDNIVFKLNSLGENLFPDQAFNNDKPIDIIKQFLPFGNEPRLFDNFSIASNEVFSKKGAKIRMDIDIEKAELLGNPTAVFYQSKTDSKAKTKVFTRGPSGGLIEVEIDPNGPYSWIDHGLPPLTTIASDSIPSAVTGDSPDSSDFVSVFARAENGHLVELHLTGNEWKWLDHGLTPEGFNMLFDPISIYYFKPPSETDKTKIETISVFVTVSKGNLYEFQIDLKNPAAITRKWIPLSKPKDSDIGSSPYAIRVEQDPINKFKIFAIGKDESLYECSYKISGTVSSWRPISSHSKPINPKFRPFALCYGPDDEKKTYEKIYVISTDSKNSNTLWELSRAYKGTGKKSKWTSLNAPDGQISSPPHGYVEHIEKDNSRKSKYIMHIFVRGDDGYIWKITSGVDKWEYYPPPSNLKIKFSPYVLFFNSSLNGNQNLKRFIFSASNNSSILKMQQYNNIAEWDEYRDPNETFPSAVLSWEYWNDKGWVAIKGLSDGTTNLLKSGKIIFDLPEDIGATEVAGQKSIWIRTRLISGDYGKETVSFQDLDDKTKQQIITKNNIKPPIVNELKLSYSFESSRYPDKTIAYNNLEFIDHTEASKIEDKFFSPFVKLEDEVKSLYLGFENYFKSGPINIYFAAKELPFKEEKRPKLEWTYSIRSEWEELDHQDDTEGLIRADILELLMGTEFSAQSRFGNYCFWIRGSLTKESEYEESPVLYGIYPNTTWALQSGTINDEILGSSDGTGNQRFLFTNIPILPGQDIKVKEMLSEEEKQIIIASQGENAIIEVKDEKGKIIENWVQWSEVSDFFYSTRQDRHYTLDHATGQLQFGDGNNGMIPPEMDNNIKAFSYRSGGGKQGNIEAGEIKSLNSAIAGIDSVFNPVGADSGADTADLNQMLEIGPIMISHRDRAVTAEDFEWLAKQASRKVVKAKCLTNINNNGQKKIGWVTLIIVPDSKEDKPLPSLELRKEVQSYLESRCENTLAHNKHIHIDSPSYAVVSVSADVFVTSIEKAFKVDREVKQKLNAFFHPLTGGRVQKGWDFGRDVSDSDIYALIENIGGVDHVEKLEVTRNFDKSLINTSSLCPQYKQSARNCDLLMSSTENKDVEPVIFNENFLIANGTHVINLKLMSESDPNGSA